MAKHFSRSVRGLLAALMLFCGGCCCDQWCYLPDDCAHAFGCTALGCEVQDVCRYDLGLCCTSCGACDCSCGDVCCDECPVACEPRGCRVKPGPPPVRYQPPMPPKFLPVPARSVFTNVSLEAPVQPGQIELGNGPEIIFPAAD